MQLNWVQVENESVLQSEICHILISKDLCFDRKKHIGWHFIIYDLHLHFHWHGLTCKNAINC